MGKSGYVVLAVSLAANAVLVWRLVDARQDESTALQACETRIEALARQSGSAVLDAERAAHARAMAALENEAESAKAGALALQSRLNEISEARNEARREIRELLIGKDCALEPLPADILERVRP